MRSYRDLLGMDVSKKKNYYRAKAACRACGGRCCKQLPGSAAPEDFGSTKEERVRNVTSALASGDWQLDRWEGEGELPESERVVSDPYWIRPRALDGNTGVFSYTWGGQCVKLTTKGCSLPPRKRPFECRMLEPKSRSAGPSCVAHFQNKLTVAEMWVDSGIDLKAIGRSVEESREPTG